MTILKDKKEIDTLREGGKILASVLYEVARKTTTGIRTMDLDILAEKMIREAGGKPSFKNYKTVDDKIAYPASLCVSVNDEVVHGIPSERIIRDGDVVNLDLGMEYKNLYTDMAITVPVGNVGERNKKLIETTKKALENGVEIIKDGCFIGDIGFAIQSFVESEGFSVVRKLVGHGLGRKPHEDPEIPNFRAKSRREILQEGTVIAIEPMVTAGGYDIYLDKDLWTWKTKDGSFSAHFEHTIIVTKTGAEIITKI